MKKLVIFGGGIAGSVIIRELLRKQLPLDIILVEPKEYLEIPFGILRALADADGFGRGVRKKIQDIFPTSVKRKLGLTPMLSTVYHIQSRVSQLDGHTAQLENGTTIDFDYAVIATGSTIQGFKALKINRIQSMEERIVEWKSYAEKLKKAGSVLIAGSGPVGIELAGEIIDHYPGKKIQLITSSGILSALSPRAGEKAKKYLEKHNVQIIPHTRIKLEKEFDLSATRITTESGDTYTADIIFPALGNCIETDFMKEKFQRAIDPAGGIRVNDFLMVTDSDHLFAVGDINNVPEIKLGAFAVRQAKTCAKNIVCLISGKGLKKYSPVKGPMGFITLGKKRGIAQLPFGRADFLIGIKQRDLFVTMYLKK
jgi:apoptosis-inducing factor 2